MRVQCNKLTIGDNVVTPSLRGMGSLWNWNWHVSVAQDGGLVEVRHDFDMLSKRWCCL